MIRIIRTSGVLTKKNVIFGVHEENKKNGGDRILEQIMAENSFNLIKDRNPQF